MSHMNEMTLVRSLQSDYFMKGPFSQEFKGSGAIYHRLSGKILQLKVKKVVKKFKRPVSRILKFDTKLCLMIK
jgi:hypothetical protein